MLELLEVGVCSDSKYYASVLHNQIANCKNADGISTVLSIVRLHSRQDCIQIFFMSNIPGPGDVGCLKYFHHL